ncbi:MAG: polysaccharide deacetylase family protein [Flavobacteriales bacterium]
MLLVHLEHPSPRARYIVRHLFERMLGWAVAFAATREEFRSATGPKLLYAAAPEDGAFFLPDSGGLRATGMNGPSPAAYVAGDPLLLFSTSAREDVLAAAFFLIAGVEEWTITARDRFGRIPADALFLVRNRLEGVPWVDRWALDLAKAIGTCYPSLPAPSRTYRHVLTVDVDNALKYQGRPFHRAIGASVKEALRGRFSATRERWRVRAGDQRDPYAALPQVLERLHGRVGRTIAFFLMRGGGAFNHGADMRHPAVRGLVRATAQHAEIGVHPSFGSSDDPALITQERDALIGIVDRSVGCSRQHFLRWRLPDTFRALAALGIQEEHSLGFSDRIGFRRGTCTPFPWYDLERDEETSLMCWPFAAMDTALRDHAGLDAAAAARAMTRSSDVVRAVQGTFVSVWHDRCLSGHGPYMGWPEAMEEVVQQARA